MNLSLPFCTALRGAQLDHQCFVDCGMDCLCLLVFFCAVGSEALVSTARTEKLTSRKHYCETEERSMHSRLPMAVRSHLGGFTSIYRLNDLPSEAPNFQNRSGAPMDTRNSDPNNMRALLGYVMVCCWCFLR